MTMAAKNADKIPAPVDTSTLNVWAKLLKVRSEFYAEGAKKTGKNLHAEFKYFELEDIVPVAAPIFAKYGLLLIPTFVEGNAVAKVVNIDDPEETICFTIPLQFIAEPAKFRMNEVQGVGPSSPTTAAISTWSFSIWLSLTVSTTRSPRVRTVALLLRLLPRKPASPCPQPSVRLSRAT